MKGPKMGEQGTLSFMSDMSHVCTFDEALEFAVRTKALDSRHGLNFKCPPNWQYDTDDGGYVHWFCTVYIGKAVFHYSVDADQVHNYINAGTPYANKATVQRMCAAIADDGVDTNWHNFVIGALRAEHRKVDHKEYYDVVVKLKREALRITNRLGYCDRDNLLLSGVDALSALSLEDLDGIIKWAFDHAYNVEPDDVNNADF